MRKKITVVFISLLALFSLPEYISAEGEFVSDYDVNYVISETGNTVITQNVTLTNRLTNLFPKEYSVKFDTLAIKNVIAFDGTGKINPRVSVEDGATVIRILFNERVVGIGNKLKFTLRFENTEIAGRNGNIWEINIPGISESPDLGSYDVSLTVPRNFGPLAYISPLPANSGKWTREQMINGGISAAYGTEQFFTVTAEYILENSTSGKKLTEIAIPPDTAFQKISIHELDPKPYNVLRDGDGNWMARYEIPPKSEITVKAKLLASVSMTIRPEFGKEQIDEQTYLSPTKYWNYNHPEIQELAKKFRSPKEIYGYVSENLTYDYERVNENPVRKGALSAVTHPDNSVCMEFTDTFIAISRAAGIPARQAVGYAYTNNSKLRPLSLESDVLHAWPEYFDPDTGTWIPIDPTWASTTGGIDYFHKLDFNHVVFAYNGQKDDYPYPAGSYKTDSVTRKIVDVRFSDQAEINHLTGSLNPEINFPGDIFSGLTASGYIKITNDIGAGLDNVYLVVQLMPDNIKKYHNIGHIPPFSSITIPVSFKTQSVLSGGSGYIEASVSGQITRKNFFIRPIYVIIFALFVFLVIFTFFIWYLISRKKRNIRPAK